MDDAERVEALVGRQFPAWAGLPVTPVPAMGTDNAVYRLGTELTVRLPRGAGAVRQLEFEREWLPRLASALPVPVPEVVAAGEPDGGQPLPWSVHRWLPGEHPGPETDQRAPAAALGEFVAALRKIDPAGAPAGYRGGTLRRNADGFPGWPAAAADLLDVPAVTAAWDRALAVPEWTGPPVWAHGDLLPGNVLVRDGRLAAVLDFGTAGVGDPACDALPAWTLFDAGARAVFRDAAGFDEDSWARGRGWALAFASGVHHYRTSKPGFSAVCVRTIERALSESD